MIDCIAGYHLNPWTCGIAKFNQILGRQLELPVVGILDFPEISRRTPLLSLKLSEFLPEHVHLLDEWASKRVGQYEVFLHAVEGTEIEHRLIRNAAKVFCGNRELHADLTGLRPDIIESFCPGTILSPQRVQTTDLNVFTFGMAHKIRVPYYRKLRDLLDASHQSYKIFVSTALHEGTSFDESFIVRFEELQEIFNGRVFFMGYLSDTAVYNHLLDATFLAAFFEKGLRANNTTVNAAMELGCAVLTNLDAHSPLGYEHLTTVLDINRCDELPPVDTLAQIGRAARDVAHTRYGWDRLVAQLKPAALARP
ncbi:MAG TPA: hypothetical protein VNJ02_05100 [Vicinamibacterales bacterium]|nr:hypothetical protein [Vicinamibacterales bacterium]